MEKGNAVDTSAISAVPVQAIESAGDRLMAVTTAVVDVTTDTAESLRDKVIDKAADAAIEEVQRRKESSQRPETD